MGSLAINLRNSLWTPQKVTLIASSLIQKVAKLNDAVTVIIINSQLIWSYDNKNFKQRNRLIQRVKPPLISINF